MAQSSTWRSCDRAYDLGGSLAGTAVGGKRVSPHSGLTDPDRGSLGDIYGERRVFSSAPRPSGCSRLPARSPRPPRRCHRGTRPPGCGRCAACAQLARGHRRRLPASERAAAIGAWTAWGAMASLVGPLAGGVIVDQLSWRWIFALNLPLVASPWYSSDQRWRRRRAPRHGASTSLGAILCALGLGGVVFALIEQPRFGWSSLAILVPLVGGLATFAAFIAYEWRASRADAEARSVWTSELRSGNRRDARAMYAGLAILFFFSRPSSSSRSRVQRRAGRVGDAPGDVGHIRALAASARSPTAYGPRLFMGVGPLVAAAGLLLLLADRHRHLVRHGSTACAPAASRSGLSA